MVTKAASLPEHQNRRSSDLRGGNYNSQNLLRGKITACKTGLVPGTTPHSVGETVMVGEQNSFKTPGTRGCNSHRPQGVCSDPWSL